MFVFSCVVVIARTVFVNKNNGQYFIYSELCILLEERMTAIAYYLPDHITNCRSVERMQLDSEIGKGTFNVLRGLLQSLRSEYVGHHRMG